MTEVSIIIPAYNAAATIGTQLSALAAEPLEDTEVLVADNGSDDGTIEVALGFQNRVPVRVIDASARRGPAAARNLGAAAATGEVLLFVDADDRVLPGWFSALRDESVSGPTSGPVLFVSRSDLEVGESAVGGRRWPTRHPRHEGIIPFQRSCNLGMRRDLLLALGGFDERFLRSQDLELSIRLLKAGHELRFAAGARLLTSRRPDIRGAARQFYEYGRFEPLLRREHRDMFDTLTTKDRVRRWLRIPGTLHRLRDASGRYDWVTNAAVCAGRAVGAVQLRRGVIG